MMEEFAADLQESLLLDKARCDAYREAINRNVNRRRGRGSRRGHWSAFLLRVQPARATSTQSR